MHRVVRALLATAALTLGLTGIASARNLTITNQAGLTHNQLLAFERANLAVLNGPEHSFWGTPHVHFGGLFAWNLRIVRNISSVAQVCGGGAAGCHFVNSRGVPGAIIATNRQQTGRIWQVTGSHELQEMLADPFPVSGRIHLFPVPEQVIQNLGVPQDSQWVVEVSDPAEDFYAGVHAPGFFNRVPTSDFATTNWYANEPFRQDWLNKLPFQNGVVFLSCPTGYAYIYSATAGGYLQVTPNCGGSRTTGQLAPARLTGTRVATADYVPIIPIAR